MKKTFLILLFALGGFCAAQTPSISGSTCIPAGGTGGQTYSLSFPTGFSAADFDSFTWTATGGIEIVGDRSKTSVVIRSLTGDTYGTKYNKYAKGRLTVSCKAKETDSDNDCPCSEKVVCNPYFTAYLDIYKSFTLDGNDIIGPDCVTPGDSVTYSVAPWVSLYMPNTVGFDEYYWDIQEGVNSSELYYSADKSSVTFIVGENVEDKKISVRIGICNNPGQTPLEKKLKAMPPDPVVEMNGVKINFSTGLCLPIGSEATTFSVANAQQGTTYKWEGLEGWNYSQDSLNLTFNPADDTREIHLKVKSRCNVERTYDLKINRSFNSSSKIKNNLGKCLAEGASVEFSVSNAAAGQPVQWSVDGDGWTIASNSTATTTVVAGTDTGIVTATDACGTTISDTIKIRPNTPAAIAGTTCLTSGDTGMQTYSIAPVKNAGSYEWAIPAGWATSGAIDGTEINLIPDGIHDGTIQVKAIGCEESSYQTLKVNIAPTPLTGITVSKDCINSGMEDQITLTAEGGDYDTYEWNVDGIGTIAGNANGKTITVKTNGIAGIYNISVTGEAQSCNTTTVKDTNIVIQGDGGRYIGYYDAWRTYYITVDGNFMNPGCTNCTYTWTLVNNGIPTVLESTISSVQILQLSDIAGSTQYLLICDILSADGCIVRKTYGQGAMPTETLSQKTRGITPQSVSAKDSSIIEDVNNIKLSIAPNPTSNVITGYLNDYSSSELKLEVFSANGKKMISTETDNRFFSLDASTLRPGLYIVIANCNGKSYQEKVILK